MFTKAERLISLRNLRPKKKEGFLKVISIFSFLGIMLGVAILIIVMSVMNGFKTDLTKKILGLNPHVVIQSNSFKIENDFEEILKKKFKKHDLIGVPYQIIIGSKSEKDKFEFKELNSKSAMLSLEDIKSQLKKR